jgi:methionyl-tRNA formyltransferase
MPDGPLRIAFCGTPAFAVPALKALLAAPDIRVEAVVTQPDRPRGRGGEVSFSPVKEAALGAGIEIYQPERVRAAEPVEYFRRLAPDCVVIIAYGQIIPARLIEIPRLGWINVHASLLPKYRGAAPINWALINGEKLTGLTTMQIDAGLDTGPMLLRSELPVDDDETAPQLAARLAEASAPLILETLRRVARDEITAQAQDNAQATLARPLTKEDGLIDWSMAARDIYNRMRGLQPWPGTYTRFRGKTCNIWGQSAAASADADLHMPATPGTIVDVHGQLLVRCAAATALRLDAVQLEGRNRVTAREFANGARLTPGERFGA